MRLSTVVPVSVQLLIVCVPVAVGVNRRYLAALIVCGAVGKVHELPVMSRSGKAWSVVTTYEPSVTSMMFAGSQGLTGGAPTAMSTIWSGSMLSTIPPST